MPVMPNAPTDRETVFAASRLVARTRYVRALRRSECNCSDERRARRCVHHRAAVDALHAVARTPAAPCVAGASS